MIEYILIIWKDVLCSIWQTQQSDVVCKHTGSNLFPIDLRKIQFNIFGWNIKKHWQLSYCLGMICSYCLMGRAYTSRLSTINIISVNTAIWFAYLHGATFVILDIWGWYCDVANVIIRMLLIQLVPWNSRNWNRGINNFVAKIII